MVSGEWTASRRERFSSIHYSPFTLLHDTCCYNFGRLVTHESRTLHYTSSPIIRRKIERNSTKGAAHETDIDCFDRGDVDSHADGLRHDRWRRHRRRYRRDAGQDGRGRGDRRRHGRDLRHPAQPPLTAVATKTA